MTPVNILRAAHIEFRVTDLRRAAEFYIDLLGFVETARDVDRLYPRGYEEWLHHSRGPRAGGRGPAAPMGGGRRSGAGEGAAAPGSRGIALRILPRDDARGATAAALRPIPRSRGHAAGSLQLPGHGRAERRRLVSADPRFSLFRADRDGRHPAASLGDLAAPQAERARHRAEDRHGTASAPRRVLDGRYRGRAAYL